MSDSNTNDEFIDEVNELNIDDSRNLRKEMPVISYSIDDAFTFDVAEATISITSRGSTQRFNHPVGVRHYYLVATDNKKLMMTVDLMNVVLQGAGNPVLDLSLDFRQDDETYHDLVHQIRIGAGYHMMDT